MGCDRERIGQLFLVPASAGEAAKGYLVSCNTPRFTSDIQVRSQSCAGGYALQALIPLACLGLPPQSEGFLFELMVTTGFGGGVPQRRASLFGSTRAYQESAGYAMAVRRGR